MHLLALHDRLRGELERRGRLAWVEEELRRLEDGARYQAMPDDERFRTVKGWQRLEGSELAVLRELAAWRERAARRANIRPNFIANDVVLVTLASRPVEHVEELRGVRGLSGGTVDRHGRTIVAAIRAGRECPKERWPSPPERVRRQAPPGGLVALLRAAVQAVADRDELASEVIASARDLDRARGLRHREGRDRTRPKTARPSFRAGAASSSARRCSRSRAASWPCATTRPDAKSCTRNTPKRFDGPSDRPSARDPFVLSVPTAAGSP